MYIDIQEYIIDKNLTENNILFVGETGDSQIIEMVSKDNNVTITDYPEYDVMNLHQVEDAQMDVIISDQVLEHIKRPQAAVDEMYRVLKPGGMCILTTCFMNPIHYDTGGENDYWRFTPNGLRVLFDSFSSIHQCQGMGDFKLLYYCMIDGNREQVNNSELISADVDDNNRTYIHVHIISIK